MNKDLRSLVLTLLPIWMLVWTSAYLNPQSDSAFAGPSARESYVITGAGIVDGSGSRAFEGSVRVEGDLITEVGRFKPGPNERVIDARGLILAPGFIDIHNHSAGELDNNPTAESQISQGITTVVLGPDGGSAFPIKDFLAGREEHPAAVNVLTFVGHATVRQRVLGSDYKRAATAQEIEKMAELVEQGMRDGAFGLSTGLEYDVGHPSTTEEIITLARVAARYRGIYMSHIRDEADLVMSALEEAIRIGEEARLPVQISHIKLGTVGVWGKTRQAIELINQARKRKVDITADCYPYDAWASTITVLVPSRKHTDPEMVKKGLDDVGGPQNVTIVNCRSHPEYEFKNLEEIAREKKTTAVQVYIDIVKDGGAGVVCRSMKESDIRAFYQQPWVMVASDGGIGVRHPRGAGTFPRVLGLYVRERRWLTLEQAIRKMTSLPASRLNLKDRGLIRKGMKADLVLFDPDKVIDRSTFKEPQLLSEGIIKVFVNGEMVWDQGKSTGKRPGRVIRNAAHKP